MRMTQLRSLRERKGFTREQLAALSGVSFATIRSHERGEVNGVETKTAEKIADVLGVELQSLFFETNTDKSVNTTEEVKESA